MKYFRYALVFVSMLYFGSGCFSGNNVPPVKQLMFEVLEPFFSESVLGEKRVIMYCPETPCELIEVDASIDVEVVYDFVLLFYLFDTSYPEFKDSDYKLPSGYNPYTELSRHVVMILSRYNNVCHSGEDSAFCVLDYLKNKYHFSTRLMVEKG